MDGCDAPRARESHDTNLPLVVAPAPPVFVYNSASLICMLADVKNGIILGSGKVQTHQGSWHVCVFAAGALVRPGGTDAPTQH